MRCYKCNGCGHRASACKNPLTCSKCGENHEARTCNSTDIKCNNCIQKNNKFKTEYNTKHTSWDLDCLTYKNIMESIKKKLDNDI